MNGYPPDQPAQLHCETCADDYCEVCFASQHRKGSRKAHTTKPLASAEATTTNGSNSTLQPNGSSNHVSLCTNPLLD